ncbi:MAG: hypothetical protein QXP41_01915 [Candidatus Nitrosocaldus sp.]
MNKIRFIFFVGIISITLSAILSEVYLKNYTIIGLWNIPYDAPGFWDSYQFAWASESYAMGYDPLIENPVNPRGHQLNYPRIWHVLFRLGINENHANILGITIMLLFFLGIGIYWFSNRFSNITYISLSIFFLSPAVMLGIERSNIELIIFFILSVALIIDRYSRLISLSVVEFAGVLKLYPVFGFVYLLKEDKKRFLRLFIIAILIFLIYIAFTFNDVLQVYKTTPKLAGSSFGINVWWMGLRKLMFFNIPISASLEVYFRIISYVIALIIVLLTLYRSLISKSTESFRNGNYLDAFRLGAGIYIGCFFIHNHDYRLIFLAFTIPQLIEWTRDKMIHKIPTITLFMMISSVWSLFAMRFLGRRITFVMEEFSNWVLFACLLYLFFVSMPEWLKVYLRIPSSVFQNKTVKN